MPNIRPSRLEDAHRLPAVERSAAKLFHQWPSLAWIADDRVLSVDEHLMFIRNALSWVAVDQQDQPIAFICAEKFQNGLHIHELAVSHAHQGQRVGRTLLQWVIDWAEQQQLATITLTTFREPPWNAPWYRTMGFHPLPETELDPRLRSILQAEVEHGMPADQRQAMCFYLNRK